MTDFCSPESKKMLLFNVFDRGLSVFAVRPLRLDLPKLPLSP